MNRPTLIVTIVLGCLAAAIPAQAQFGRIGDAMKRTKDVAEAFTPISTEQEVAIGREVAAKMIGYFKVYENEKVAGYVRKVGATVAMQAERQDVSYYFEVLDTDDVNAFATPGGYIFITRGLLDTLTSEAELAGVLGHEVGHVAGKHVVNEIQRGKAVQAGIKEAGSFSPGSRYLTQVAGEIIGKLLTKGLEPGSENDADKRGVNYAYAAGYRPDGLRDALRSIQSLTDPANEKKAWLTRTHPPIAERIKRVEEQMGQQKMQTEGKPTLAERYQAAMK